MGQYPCANGHQCDTLPNTMPDKSSENYDYEYQTFFNTQEQCLEAARVITAAAEKKGTPREEVLAAIGRCPLKFELDSVEAAFRRLASEGSQNA